jgi:hypothetical protein
MECTFVGQLAKDIVVLLFSNMETTKQLLNISTILIIIHSEDGTGSRHTRNGL